MSMIYGGSNVTFPDGTTQNTAPSGMGFKNRIINGAMMIDQRNAGASVTSGGDTYCVDRWSVGTGAPVNSVTAQQSTTVPTAGFKNSLVITAGTGASAGTTGYAYLRQNIEGFNIADLGWGTASAASITLSFWVCSSLTGTFGVVIRNNAGTRGYGATFTISAANTFEYKTITVAGDTTGTWLTDNSGGIGLFFDLGAGSTYSIASGSWQATSNPLGVSGVTKLTATTGATFYITGVQLEKGSTATSFDYRPYGTELALCQRYCTVFGGTATYEAFCSMFMASTTVGIGQLILPTPMRAVPTLTAAAAGNYRVYQGSSAPTASSISNNSYPTNTLYDITAVISGGTAGAGGQLQSNNTTNNKLILSAEL